MSVRASKEMLIIFKTSKPVTQEIQQRLDDLQKALSLQLRAVLKQEPDKAKQMLDIMLINSSKASKEMQELQ